MLKEIELYRPFLKGKRISSIYIGGGTPFLMISEITRILEKMKSKFHFEGDAGMEIHPREATPGCLAAVKKAGINLVSVGVQSFHPASLNFLERGYKAEDSHRAVVNTLHAGFDAVDADLMYNIPGQMVADIENDFETCLSYGVDQVSVYPLIVFPLTSLQQKIKLTGARRFSEMKEYKIRRSLDQVAAAHGYEQTSIWTYGKKGAKRYTSVTRDTFLGVGASAASLYDKYFYLNTFDAKEYVKALDSGRFPISLVNTMSPRERQVFWLFWRCYDTVISRRQFSSLFGASLDKTFPMLVAALKLMGMARDCGETLKLTGFGSFCYHFVEKQYSLKYLNNLWDASRREPWPKRLEL